MNNTNEHQEFVSSKEMRSLFIPTEYGNMVNSTIINKEKYNLNNNEIVVYYKLLEDLDINKNVDENGLLYANAFQRELLERINISDKTLRNTLKTLEEKRLIKKSVVYGQRCFGGANRYYFYKLTEHHQTTL